MNNKIIPILLGTTALISAEVRGTSMQITEKEITQGLTGISNDVLIYAQSASDISTDFYFEVKFEMHYNRWKYNNAYQSNIDQVINDPDFQSIIEMKDNAIPFILEKIADQPSYLVWALNLITNKKISNNPNLTISESCKRWIKWGEKQNLLKYY